MTAAGDLSVVVVAPIGRDARLICDTLSRRGILSVACPSVRDLCLMHLTAGVGAVVLWEEVLTPGALNQILKALSAQPKWSDIGLILITSDARRTERAIATTLQTVANRSLVVLERPVRMLTFVTTVASVLNARRRQYELRDHLEERARQEEQLRVTQKLESIGVLAGGIAHDFNNLLTSILGNTSLALDTLPWGSDLRRLLTEVVIASERAADLTRQLLAYAGKGRFYVQSLDLSEHVRQISNLLRTSIPRTVTWRVDLAPGLPRIQADSSQIQQVIMNLVINAAEAILEGQPGTVLIVTGTQEVGDADSRPTLVGGRLTPGRYVTLEVQDSGVGMNEKTMGRIFDPFFTTKFIGRGLGLAAVLGIMRGHKGGISVSSTPGQGATFQVFFPATEDRQPAPEETETSPRPFGSPLGTAASVSLAGTGTVLIIDDEEIVRHAARAALEVFGYAVLEAEDGERGVELFLSRADDVAVVLLDMTMPVMSGEETFRRLRAIRPNVKVILSSGYDEPEANSRFTGKGLAGFLQKPYTGARLAKTIFSSLAPG
jgi:signal transduction histidine kinase/CheY-like chemotaxis protein